MEESRSIRLKKQHKRQSLLRSISAVVIGLSLVIVLLLGWFCPVFLSDPSMEPTLGQGETILYDRLYKHFFRLGRSDMIVFRDPQTDAILIKRIVGLEGETVSAKDGVLLIDEQFALNEYDYLSPSLFDIDPVTVPKGHVFVLSDNRSYGEDSRSPHIGCISEADVLGIVRFRIDRFTFFGH